MAIGGIQEGEPVPACPAESQLVPELRERWDVPQDAALDVVACTRGRFGRAGWLIDAFIDHSDDESEERVEILAADGGGIVAAREPDESLPYSYRHETGAGNTWEVVDLDADGKDEMLLFQEWDRRGVRSTSVAVYRLDGGRIVAAGSLPLAFDNEQEGASAARRVRCAAQHGISDGPDGSRHIMVEGRVEIAGRRAAGTVAESCPKPGSHRYGLVGGALAEVKP